MAACAALLAARSDFRPCLRASFRARSAATRSARSMSRDICDTASRRSRRRVSTSRRSSAMSLGVPARVAGPTGASPSASSSSGGRSVSFGAPGSLAAIASRPATAISRWRRSRSLARAAASPIGSSRRGRAGGPESLSGEGSAGTGSGGLPARGAGRSASRSPLSRDERCSFSRRSARRGDSGRLRAHRRPRAFPIRRARR